MHDERPVPSWSRRRLMRHLARRGSPLVVRWMHFAAVSEAAPPAPPTTRYPDNVVPFRPRAAVCR
ncbi:hypothetical protein [Methylobacterium sp. sgz302541]|uniref:hypothetical protein n=1 Tax=unclassified Methylobacterium TaxID=2615210 RepID=UPI003D339F06